MTSKAWFLAALLILVFTGAWLEAQQPITIYWKKDFISDGNGVVAVATPAPSDTTAPSIPEDLEASSTSAYATTLTWSAATDTGGSELAGYRLYRVLTVGGTPIGGVSIVGTIAAGTETFTDPTLFAANAYEYKIAAFDKAGNQSALSAAASVTTTVLLTAVTVNNGQIDVSWAATGGADHYELSRKTTGAWSTVGGEISATSYSDTSVSSSTAYFYRVRAMNSQDEPISLYSNTDIALTVSFTDDPLTVGVTPAKATHFTELRQAIDLARVAAGLGNASWSSLSSGSTITAAHLTELRSNLNAAFGILGVLTPAYTDPTLTAGTTTIKRAHIAELRTALR